jgi:hypothetical protein
MRDWKLIDMLNTIWLFHPWKMWSPILESTKHSQTGMIEKGREGTILNILYTPCEEGIPFLFFV